MTDLCNMKAANGKWQNKFRVFHRVAILEVFNLIKKAHDWEFVESSTKFNEKWVRSVSRENENVEIGCGKS